MGRGRKGRGPSAQRGTQRGTQKSAPTGPLKDPLPGSGKGAEGWGLAAYALALATLATWGVLGSRPGGSLQLWLYGQGRFHLVLAGLLVAVLGLARSLRHRPLLQRRRLWPAVALAFTIGIAPFPVPYPAPRERAPSTQSVQLPVEGPWRVRWGGEGVESNPLVLDPARRFGLVLVRDAAPAGATEPGAWPALDASVLSPAAGRVAAVVEELPDGPPEMGRDPVGNRVVLDLGAGEFLWVTGLAQGSVLPGPGDEVQQGQPLARVGWSAAGRPTWEPHLGLFMASTPELETAEGIPWRLDACLRDGTPWAGTLPAGGVDWEGRPRGPLLERAP
jgi:hypothetical protein